jgi:hypothetical protein
MKRKLVLVPEELITGSIDTMQALEWCTDEVLRLDAENQKLKDKVRQYEGIHALHTA